MICLLNTRCLSATLMLWLAVSILAPNKSCAEDEKANLLEKLKGFDAVYHQGLTLVGETKSSGVSSSPIPPGKMRLRFTAGGSFQGIILESIDRHKSFDLRTLAKLGVDVDNDRGGFLINGLWTATLGRQVLRAIYEGGDKSADIRHIDLYKLNDEHTRVVKDAENRRASSFPPGSSDLSLQYKKVLWCSGRGLSSQILEITDVNSSANGKYIVKANGHESPVNHGQWELEIEAEDSYLVRKGRFIQTGGTELFSFENSDLAVEDGIAYPRKAIWRQLNPFSGKGISEEIEFSSISLALDKALVEEAREFVNNRNVPNTLILDSVGGKTKTGYINSDGSLVVDGVPKHDELTKLPPGQFGFWKMGIIVLNLAVVILLLLALWLRAKS